MSGCEKYQELISCLVDGTITESKKKKLMKHVETCAECAEFLNICTEISGLASDDAEPPEELLSGVMEGVRRINSSKSSKKPARITYVRWAAAAACFAVVCFIGVTVMQRGAVKSDSAAMEAYSLMEFADVTYAEEEVAEAEISNDESADYGYGADDSVSNEDDYSSDRVSVKSSFADSATKGSSYENTYEPYAEEEAEEASEFDDEATGVTTVNLAPTEYDIYGKYDEVIIVDGSFDLLAAFPNNSDIVAVTLSDGTDGIEFPSSMNSRVENTLALKDLSYTVNIYGDSDVSLFISN